MPVVLMFHSGLMRLKTCEEREVLYGSVVLAAIIARLTRPASSWWRRVVAMIELGMVLASWCGDLGRRLRELRLGNGWQMTEVMK